MTEPGIRSALADTGASVTTDAGICAAHGQDWGRRFHGPVLAVVRPTSAEHVAAVLRVCSAAGVPVVPQGGNTSLVGGSVPSASGPASVILATTGLTRIDPVDPVAAAVTVGAGVSIATLAEHAEAAGLRYGVDLASRESATVGGTIATNAGGIRVCAYGMTRAQVLGLEYVLADGTIVSRLAGLPKDNTGYDLSGLLAGSEGTLAVITAARLRLHPAPPPTMVLMAGVDSLHGGLALLRSCVPAGAQVFGAEIMDAAGLELVGQVAGLPAPLPLGAPYTMLIEATEFDPPGDLEAVAAVDAADVRRFWTYRERMSEAVSTLGVVHKLDVSAPFAALDELVRRMRLVTPDEARIIVFGHLADGNLHIEIAGLDPEDLEADRRIFDIAAELGGVVSAEHGVGRAKAPLLGLSRSTDELRIMRGIKAVFDPMGTLNPGALFAWPPLAP